MRNLLGTRALTSCVINASSTQLGLIVLLCRKRSVRHRILHLLKHWPPGESIWFSKLIANMAEAGLQAEEEGWLLQHQPCGDPPCVSGEYVCFPHRITMCYLAFGKDGEVEMRLRTVRDIQSGAPERKFILDQKT